MTDAFDRLVAYLLTLQRLPIMNSMLTLFYSKLFAQTIVFMSMCHAICTALCGNGEMNDNAGNSLLKLNIECKYYDTDDMKTFTTPNHKYTYTIYKSKAKSDLGNYRPISFIRWPKPATL